MLRIAGFSDFGLFAYEQEALGTEPTLKNGILTVLFMKHYFIAWKFLFVASCGCSENLGFGDVSGFRVLSLCMFFLECPVHGQRVLSSGVGLTSLSTS